MFKDIPRGADILHPFSQISLDYDLSVNCYLSLPSEEKFLSNPSPLLLIPLRLRLKCRHVIPRISWGCRSSRLIKHVSRVIGSHVIAATCLSETFPGPRWSRHISQSSIKQLQRPRLTSRVVLFFCLAGSSCHNQRSAGNLSLR